jgi:hypothetical protein
VTAGSHGEWPLNPLTVGPNTLIRIWNGGDGKTETHDGFLRTKWNGFTCDVVGSAVSYPYFKILWLWKPTGETWTEDKAVTWNNGTFNWDEPQFYKPPYRPLSECLDELLSKVKGHDFNLGVELGQAHQTIGLLSENLRKLGRAALALKRGDFSTAARCLGASPKGTRLKPSDISGRWLELQYGWLPLISSSYEAAQAFAAIYDGPRKVLFRVAKRRKATWNLSTAPNTYSLKADGYVRTAIQYEMYEEMSFTRQLGLQDPLSIAWELTPWSFVVDWFIPFGTYLSNLNQIPKLKGRWMITDSLKVNPQSVSCEWLATLGGGNQSGTIIQKPAFRWWMSKVRRTVTESPPGVPFPQFRFGLNSSRRFFNALSLAHQRFK